MKYKVLMSVSLACLLFVTVHRSAAQHPSNIDNPVLPGVADAGVMKFNGEYYIGGVFTNGDFYKSRDLVNWDKPVHVFSMHNNWTDGRSAGDSQIHANDIVYVNGVFHQYWSVNYWGSDRHVVHIGHATARDALGPYREPVTDTWLDNRIDPKLFIDDDGVPYLYMVKFTDGNTIWGRPMKDPWTFSGVPTFLFSALPNTWEMLDNKVAEGPWVMKYRDRYYMMYNTNHTSTRWGNYALGVAEADSPLGFNHGSKYPSPVVQSNQIALGEQFVDLLAYTGPEKGVFRYTFDTPDKKWNTSRFDASGWHTGKAGFGSERTEGSTTRKVRTEWKTPEIWARKEFVLDETTKNLMLRIHHDGDTRLFLNGQLFYDGAGRQYTTWNFDQQARSLLRKGTNVLSVYSRRGGHTNFLDVSVFDMGNKTGDDILFSPGQPNILRGPNGFEWWLIYMANKNAERRGQFINRVHFFNRKLVVDAITGGNTPGYHPVPAKPTFSDLFNEENGGQNKWDVHGGRWQTSGGEYTHTGNQAAHALAKTTPASHYLFEVGVKMRPETTRAGVYAWLRDSNNSIKVLFDRERGAWSCVRTINGKTGTQYFPLGTDFDFDVYHSVRILKNAGVFTIEIDERPAPSQAVLRVEECSGNGLPGLYAEGNAAFDGVIYTIGWDEFDDTITGWSSSSKGSARIGDWSVSADGIRQSDSVGLAQIFKGDMLDEYEIGVQVTNETNRGRAGIYPVYRDNDNFLKAVVDFESGELIVSGKHRGKAVAPQRVGLETKRSYHADMKFTDFIEKHFTLDAPANINAIYFSKVAHNEDTLIEDIYKKVNVHYQSEGQWFALSDWKEDVSAHPGFDKIAFPGRRVEALKVVNREPEDHRFYIYKILVNEVVKQSYNLRAVKQKDTVIFFVDGREVLRMNHAFDSSQTGLATENTRAVFNGITAFDLRW